MITYTIDPDRRRVTVTATGILKADEISAFQAEVARMPGFDPSHAVLIDFSNASFSALEAADVRKHAMQDPFGRTSPRAVVVGQETDRSIVRMFEIYSEMADRTGPVQAFTDLAAAIAWIESVQAGGG